MGETVRHHKGIVPEVVRALACSDEPRPRCLLSANTSWYLYNFRLELGRRLAAAGCEVVFVSPPDTYTEQLNMVGAHFPISVNPRGRNLIQELLTLTSFARIAVRTKPAVILTWTPKMNIYCSLVGRILGIPVVPNVSGLGSAFVEQSWLAKVAGALYRAAFQPNKIVFFQNSDDRDRFVRSGWVAAEASRLLPGSGVNLNHFSPRDGRNQTGPFRFLFVGRLIPEKGIRDLIAAMRLLREWGVVAKLDIFGTTHGPDSSAISSAELTEWQDSGLADYHGHTDTIIRAYMNSDCIVLPSYYREGVPRVLLEAAACGLPSIACDIPGSRHAIRDGITGFLCKPKNPLVFARAMRRMIEIPAPCRLEMGRAARKHVESYFSEERVLEAYLDVLANLGVIQRHATPPGGSQAID